MTLQEGELNIKFKIETNHRILFYISVCQWLPITLMAFNIVPIDGDLYKCIQSTYHILYLKILNKISISLPRMMKVH